MRFPFGMNASDAKRQSIDTTTPTGRLMFQIVGAFAEFERIMIRQRVHAGLKRAVANGKTLVGHSMTPAPLNAPVPELRQGTGIVKVAKQVGLGVGTVHRLALGLRSVAPASKPCTKPHDAGLAMQPSHSGHIHTLRGYVRMRRCFRIILVRACSKPLLI